MFIALISFKLLNIHSNKTKDNQKNPKKKSYSLSVTKHDLADKAHSTKEEFPSKSQLSSK
jgi:hypothetical protein